jgi:hypothetical protein
MSDGKGCLPGMRTVEASMPGESTLTAEAAEQAVSRNLSKSEHRGDEAEEECLTRKSVLRTARPTSA